MIGSGSLRVMFLVTRGAFPVQPAEAALPMAAEAVLDFMPALQREKVMRECCTAPSGR